MKMYEKEVLLLVASTALFLNACQSGRMDTNAPSRSELDNPDTVFEGPVPRADCGPGSMPETDIQGRVSLEDRTSGRSQQGYSCNLELVGQHQGRGASWQHAWHEDCAYYGTSFPGQAGVQVIDVSDPTNPRHAGALRSPAMLDPWESLKVHEKRGLLSGGAGWNGSGPLFFDIYDLNGDCAQPNLLSSTPTAFPAGHEGDWAPDGKTYYVGGTTQSAIDVSDPNNPQLIAQVEAIGSLHGLSLNADGSRMYAVNMYACSAEALNGLVIYDTTAVQNRELNPAMPVIGSVCWADGSTAQHTILVHYDGKPYVVFVDEGGGDGTGLGSIDPVAPAGSARIIDISDETQPRVVSKIKLEIHMPEHADIQASDVQGNGIFGYQAHYCSVDRQDNPTALACGFFQSGIRVFDIRDPLRPAEIAYYNPPAQVGRNAELSSSEHANGTAARSNGDGPAGVENNLTADWCTAQVRLIPERGELWTTCQDNGFMVLRFTNGVWPLN